MGKLDGKVAVVTGGNSGIGLAAAKEFIVEGAYVYITGRRQAELDAAVASIGKNVTGVQGDIAKLDDIDKLYAAVAEGHGKFDILFANAGGGAFLPLGEVTEEHFDQIFRTNVKGTVFSVQKALPFLNDGGSIILNGSTASIMGTESLGVYSATKAALRSFVRSWTLDLKGKKLRVNLVSPGATDTPGFRGVVQTEEELAQLQAALVNSIPLGRIAEPVEIAKAAVFLASDDSSYVNGIELFVDGGLKQV